VQLTPGAIGYLEYAYAELAHLPMVTLENHAGKFVAPNVENSKKALRGARIPNDLQIKVPDPALDPDAYPIVTYTWLLCRGHYADANVARTLRDVLSYCLVQGQELSAELGYLPLPPDVVARLKLAIEALTADTPAPKLSGRFAP